MIKEIPLSEREERINKIQEELKKRDLDAYLVHSSEIDFANVLYLSNHWSIWETLGVIIPKEGEAVLLVGPEAEGYAKSRSTIKKIRKLLEYRESAEPEYPDIPLSNFEEIFDEISNGKGIKRIGIGDYGILPVFVYDSIKKAIGKEGEIIRAEDIISNLRIVKSDNEISLMKQAAKISEKVLDEILGKIKPGLTEKEVVGLALEAIYRNGAECEAYPQYVFSGLNSRNPINRSTYKKIKRNEIIQLCIGARFAGYASSMGRALVIGKMTNEMKRIIKFAIDIHHKVYDWIKEGVMANEVAKKYKDYFIKNGFEKNYLYGPCHGTGIIEVEKPWMETNSNYVLKKNMTFMNDNHLFTPEFGLVWEDGFRVTENGIEDFSNKWQEVIEL